MGLLVILNEVKNPVCANQNGAAQIALDPSLRSG
jgi:hypothetical protein